MDILRPTEKYTLAYKAMYIGLLGLGRNIHRPTEKYTSAYKKI